MKTKSILLIAVSLGFGLIAAIGMSQVLGQKSAETAPEVEMVQVYVASKPLEIGDELKLEENLNVKKRPITDIPENAIKSKEELENMVAIQKVPKGVLIVSNYIMDKFVAKVGRQPPVGYRAFTIKTNLEDTHHNSVQAGDRIDIVGVFRFRNEQGKEMRAPSTFLKNIEVWQVNDKGHIGVDGEENDRIATITVLLTPKQVEIALLAIDIASVVRVVKTNRNAHEEVDDDFDLSSLTGIRKENKDDEEPKQTEPKADVAKTDASKSQQLLNELNAVSSGAGSESKQEDFKFKMTIYRGGQAVKYGFTDKSNLPKIIEQTAATENPVQPTSDPTVKGEDDFSDRKPEAGPDSSEEFEEDRP